jgi:hypothetical protein
MQPSPMDSLRSLAVGDRTEAASRRGATMDHAPSPRLDARSAVLLRLGALIALDAAQPSLQHAISDALATGFTAEDLIDGVLLLTPIIGSAVSVSVAPKIALSLGFDLDAEMDGL